MLPCLYSAVSFFAQLRGNNEVIHRARFHCEGQTPGERERERAYAKVRRAEVAVAGRLGGEATLLVKCPGLTISLGENRMSATVEVDATDRLKLGLS